MSRPIDLTGRRFGRLTVTERDPTRIGHWRCRCDCGGEKSAFRGNLHSGATSSCGCWNSEQARQRFTKHGASAGYQKTDEYITWKLIRQRCLNPRSKTWTDYGGRGIVMCERWHDDFAAFLADMGPKPSKAHSIERKDNDGPYSPDNCEWAVRLVQMNNQRRNLRLTFNGKTQTLAQWARELGMSAGMIQQRITGLKWSAEKALTTPSSRKHLKS